jgi:hypothetical protein
MPRHGARRHLAKSRQILQPEHISDGGALVDPAFTRIQIVSVIPKDLARVARQPVVTVTVHRESARQGKIDEQRMDGE